MEEDALAGCGTTLDGAKSAESRGGSRRLLGRCVVVLSVAIVLASLASPAWTDASGEEASLEDVLAGFDDDQATDDGSDDLADVLSGFDDQAPAEAAATVGDVDDVLAGFDDDDASSSSVADGGAAAERWWDITGNASLGASYNLRPHRSSVGAAPNVSSGTYYGNLQRLRLRVHLQLDLDLPADWKLRAQGFGYYDLAYVIHDRRKYTRAVLDAYEYEFEILDLFVEGTLFGKLDLKLGRQVVNWGRSDTLRVNDVLNPLNDREPGLGDIEELRLPVTMAKADYYLGDFSFTAIVIPEARFDKNPPPGSDFFPPIDLRSLPPVAGLPDDDTLEQLSRALASADLLPSKTVPRWGGTPEFAAAVSGVFSGWDFSLYASRTYQNRKSTLIGLPTLGGFPQLFEGDDLVSQVGTGANLTLGSWLFKAELAYLHDLDYTILVPDLSLCEDDSSVLFTCFPYGVLGVESGRIDSLLGIEYYGWSDISVALEVAYRRLLEHNDLLQYTPNFLAENFVELALRVSADGMNQRIHFTGVAVALFSERGHHGSVIRLGVDYDLRDALVLGGGVLYFVGSDEVPLDRWKDNDRLFLKLKYSF